MPACLLDIRPLTLPFACLIFKLTFPVSGSTEKGKIKMTYFQRDVPSFRKGLYMRGYFCAPLYLLYMHRRLSDNLTFRIVLLMATTALTAVSLANRQWLAGALGALASLAAAVHTTALYRRNLRKIAFMFDAVDNDDLTFHFATRRQSPDDTLLNEALNRMLGILLQTKADAMERERYYESILRAAGTGIVVIDPKGFVLQRNDEALRLLGLPLFTHVRQLERIDRRLADCFAGLRAGERYDIAFSNERGDVRLSIHVSETVLRGRSALLAAINDIRGEMEDTEVETWVRLTRILTHEIMNAVTPITSVSDTLRDRFGPTDSELRAGLETISETGKGLMAFVESYRRLTRIPTPQPTLFYVRRFVERMLRLTLPAPTDGRLPITVDVDIRPDNLILYADENLISQVMLNLLKNAVQAIGPDRLDGRIRIVASCCADESVEIEVSNNGTPIPPDVAEHIFTPFFTTKSGGSGIGLSVARQIMRLSGGAISLKRPMSDGLTTFLLRFP